MDSKLIRDRWWFKLALLMAGMLAIYLRRPAFFHEPRFWAEEATRHFGYAYAQPWPAIFAYNYRGFFSLFNKVAALLAVHLVDLPHAPLVTTLLAFGVQIVPLALILWSESRPWDTLAGKVLGVSIVLFTLLSGEIWLNTVNSQFYLGLIAFLILLEDTSETTRLRFGVHLALLLLAGLTGMVSCFLTPLYAVKAWKERTRPSLVYLAAMAACSAVQLAVLLSSGGQWAGRGQGLQPVLIPPVVWVKTIVLPLFGPAAARRFAEFVLAVRDLGALPFGALSAFLALAVVVFWTVLLWKACTYRRLLILGSYVLVVVLSIVGSIGADKSGMIHAWNGQRYFYVPSVMLLALMLSRIELDGSRYHKVVSAVCAALVVTSIIVGVVHYRGTVIAGSDWPKWREEVAKWELDHSYALQVWPKGWQVELAPRE